MTLPPRTFAPRARKDRIDSPRHRAFVRTHLCILWKRMECAGKIDCCHARDVVPRSGSRPSDEYTYSACRKHHREAEKRELDWGRETGIDVLATCLEFAAASPDKAIRDAAAAHRRADGGRVPPPHPRADARNPGDALPAVGAHSPAEIDNRAPRRRPG